MNTTFILVVLSAVLVGNANVAAARDRPAPPTSRFNYTLKFDEKTLPEGVVIEEVSDSLGTRYFIRNTSETPLVIKQRFQGDRLVAGAKLVSGKVYQFFPNGVPMQGKQHLKGWQAPFGDIPRTILMLEKEPDEIYAGRHPGLSKKLPDSQLTTIPAEYDGKPHEIKVTIHFGLNPKYDQQ